MPVVGYDPDGMPGQRSRTIEYAMSTRVLRVVVADLPAEAYPELCRVLRDALGSPADPAELRLAESFAEQLLDWLERSYRRHIDERTKAEAAEILIAMVNLRTALARPRYQGPTSRSSEADAS
jgi:hypothetical protein